MASGLEFKITGLDAALTKMRGLAPALRAKGARTAMRKAANLVRDAAAQNARQIDDPATVEDIGANIAVRFSNRTLKTRGDVMFRIGVAGGARQYANTTENRRKQRVGKLHATGGSVANPGGDTFYWRFVEFGTSRAPARPFMQPALANNVDSATDVAANELERAIDRQIKKAGSA